MAFSSILTFPNPLSPPPTKKMATTPRMTEAPTGPHQVAVSDAQTKTQRVRLFYPTDASRATPAPWLPPSKSYPNETVVNILKFASLPTPLPFMAAPFLHYLHKSPLPAGYGTKMKKSKDANGWPVVLFSHGLGGSTGGYSNACIERASWGYVVVAPEHTDGSAFQAVAGLSNRLVPYERYKSSKHGSSDLPFRRQQLEERVETLQELLSVLHDVNDGRGKFSSLNDLHGVPEMKSSLNLHDLSLIGHSFGAATVLHLVHKHPEHNFRNLILLDAWVHALQADIDLYDLRDTNTLFVDQALSSMHQSRVLREKIPKPSGGGLLDAVKITGGMHNNASDFPLRVPNFIAVSGGMTAPGSDPLQFLKKQNEAINAFWLGESNWIEYRSKLGEQEGVEVAGLGAGRVFRSGVRS